MLKTLHAAGIKAEDYKWLALYHEYTEMKRQGEKTTYVVAVLAGRYGVCERKVYKVVRAMEHECRIGAARDAP